MPSSRTRHEIFACNVAVGPSFDGSQANCIEETGVTMRSSSSSPKNAGPRMTRLDLGVKAVNEHGGFGVWKADVVLQPKEVLGILQKHAAATDVHAHDHATI